MKALVPTRTETTFEDGAFIKALDFCKKNCFSDTCQKFYSGITEKNTNQFLACPHGMSVYVGKTNGEYVYFICLRNKDAYDSKKAKKISNAPDTQRNAASYLRHRRPYRRTTRNQNGSLGSGQLHQIRLVNAGCRQCS